MRQRIPQLSKLVQRLFMVLVGTMFLGPQLGCGPTSDSPAQTQGRVPYNSSVSTGGSALGIWLWQLAETGYGSHDALASDLAAMGVKRIYVKVGDGAYAPNDWREVADSAVVEAYRSRGLQVWAWMYAYPGDAYDQATNLYGAARVGYDGFVVDIEEEFDGRTDALHELFAELHTARDEAVNAGLVAAELPLYCTTWGNPADHDMHVEIIDQYVDAHLPQTYLEVWGPSYPSAARHWIEVGTQEYRDLGCSKPIHHIFSVVQHGMTVRQVDQAVLAAGAEASLWRVPTAGDSASWDLLRRVSWHRSFSGDPAGSIVLNAQTEYNVGQAATFSGSTQGDIRTILGIIDGVVVINQAVDGQGNFEFQYTLWSVAEKRSLAVEGYDAQSRLVTRIQTLFDVVDQAPAELTLDLPATATVGMEAVFSGSASAPVVRVVVTIDGWQVGDEPVVAGVYSFEYSFTGAAPNRQVVARGYDAQLNLVAQAVDYLDVTAAAEAPPEEEPPVTSTPTVPYFYQYANSINPGGSCQNTSMAMILRHFGASSVTPDSISGYWGTSAAQTVAGFENVFNSDAAYYGLAVRDAGTQSGTVAQLRDALSVGLPVVVHGYFTSYGHVMVLLDFDGAHYTAHDPAGSWNEVYQGGGYSGWHPTDGQYITYSAAALEAAVAPDGYVWMHEFYVP